MELRCHKPAHARSLKMLKETKKKSLLEALERARHLDSGLQNCWRINFHCFKPLTLVVLCYLSSLGNQCDIIKLGSQEEIVLRLQWSLNP